MTDKPKDGYDPGTIADDLVAVMDVLGHERFALVGTDTGLPIAYALSADHPERVERVVLAEVPGPPGAVPSPPFFCPEPLNNGLWHIAVNRLGRGERATRHGTGGHLLRLRVQHPGRGEQAPERLDRLLRQPPTNPDSLHGTFAFYREWDALMAQNEQCSKQPLTMPVLAVSGVDSWGEAVGEAFKPLANDVQSAVIPGAGHWFAEQAPEETLAALVPS